MRVLKPGKHCAILIGDTRRSKHFVPITPRVLMSFLERGFLIQKCYNFSRNRLTSEKKMKRLYLSSTTLLFHLCEAPDFGRAVENLVINSSKAQFFWRRGTSEVDCVLIMDGSIVPLESKYKNSIQKKEIKGLIKFLKEFSIEKGYVVTKETEEEVRINGNYIIFVPLWKWLLRLEEIKTKKKSEKSGYS